MSEPDELHDAAHEEWLAELLAGEQGVGDPAVAERLSRCTECREQYAALRELADELSGDAEFESRVLADAEHEPIERPALDVLDRMRSEKLATTLDSGRSDANRLRLVPWVRAAVIAAAVIVGAIWLLRPTTIPPVRDGNLGIDPKMTPGGLVDSIEAFEFDHPVPPGGFIRIRIREIADDGTILESSERIESPDLTEPRWRLPSSRVATLPHRIRWFVDVYDARGSFQRTYSQDAELRSR